MKGIGLVVSALLVGALAFGESAEAQTRFGVAAGLAVPTGDAGEGLSSGFNVEGNVEFKPMTMPFGVRGDLSYSRFGAEVGDGHLSALGGALNALFQMSGIGAAPYLVVGPTITNLDGSGGGEGQTKIGAQGGVGVKFPLSGFTSRVEGRYHTIFAEGTNFNMFIVNFGILFGGVE